MTVIGDIATVKGGKRLPKGTWVQDVPTAHPYIRVKDFTPQGINEQQVRYITKDVHQKISRYTIGIHDIYISIAGTIGLVGMIPESMDGANLTENAAKICIQKHAKFDAKFVEYYLKSGFGQREIASRIVGTSQPKLALFRIKAIPLPETPIAKQKSISKIIKKYDELIENNLRRAKVLEEVAQLHYGRIYRMSAKVNWEEMTLDKIIAGHIGGGWGKEEPDAKHNQIAFVIRGTDIPAARFGDVASVPCRHHSKSNLRSRRLHPGDIIFEVSGGSKGQPLGRALLISPRFIEQFNGNDLIPASFCKRVTSNNQILKSEILYLSFLEAYKNGEIETYSVQSTGISNFKWSDYLKNVKRAIPPADIQNDFVKTVGPIFKMIALLGQLNSKLALSRDMLLPRLMSGEIKV